MTHHPDPKRHQEVEPEQDDKEVELVLCIAEEQEDDEMQRIGKAHTVEPAIVQKVEEGPDEIRHQHRLEPALQKKAEVEGSG